MNPDFFPHSWQIEEDDLPTSNDLQDLDMPATEAPWELPTATENFT